MLQRLFERYTGFLRSLKAVYVLNNLLHARQLRANRPLYRRYGLKKSVFAPLAYADFSDGPGRELPWLDRADARIRLEEHPRFQQFSPEWQGQIRRFVQDGYLILEGFYPQAETDALNAEVDRLLSSGQVGFNYTGRKIFNLFERNEVANRQFFRNPQLLDLLSFLLGRPVIPFQSLNFVHGSEQRAHSDSIHMTTEPPGFLIATWTALEDCTPHNGPLFYFPGSHRLSFISTRDYDSGNTRFAIGQDSNRRYEDAVEKMVRAHGLEPRLFLARRGDVLIWHANLLHGGLPISPGHESDTRKSMVCHYFAEGAICYHEMSQRPALLPARTTS